MENAADWMVPPLSDIFATGTGLRYIFCDDFATGAVSVAAEGAKTTRSALCLHCD